VRFVVLIVIALGDVRVLGTEVARGPVHFHIQPPSIWRSAGCRAVTVSQYPRETGAMVAVVGKWFWERDAAQLPQLR
jgi:hypothetical protein